MKTIAMRLVPLACLIVALLAAPFARAAPPDPMMASRVVELINQARQQQGLSPVAISQKLMQVAQAFAEDLARRRMLAHTDGNGNGIDQRFMAADYVYALADEAVFGGSANPDEVVATLLSQPGNRDSLLNPTVRDAGVGFAFRRDDTPNVGLGSYWVIDLGVPVERGPGP
ncbi:MAG: CAP domain-containing protein [Alphaproteobacteria bacterium]